MYEHREIKTIEMTEDGTIIIFFEDESHAVIHPKYSKLLYEAMKNIYNEEE